MSARHDPPTGDDPDANAPGAEPSDEARWAEIVAELGDLGTDLAALTDGEGTSTPPAVTYPVAPWVSDTRSGRTPSPSGRDWDGTDQIDRAEAEVDAAEHFVPPDPGPVLGGNPLLTLAWIGAAGAPILLLVLVTIGQRAPAIIAQVAFGVFAVSVALLVWRMPNHRDDDDGPGAVV